MNILLVEDDARVARFIAKGLTAEGYNCDIVGAAQPAWDFLRISTPDLIILDRMLPGTDGVSLCEEIRAKGYAMPVLMLTAMDAVEERVGGLRAGADDYMTKPFDFDELLARIEALARRLPQAPDNRDFALGPLRIDTRSRRSWVDEVELNLTALEFDLLRLFVENLDTALSRERILNRVWGQSVDPLTNVVDVYIGRLRRKLESTTARGMLQTVRGVGYRLSLPQDT
nr:response regulator transcription factor [Oceanococcus sp. HetDA_MAG_MS8]